MFQKTINKNYTLFENTEFANWANRDNLILEEKFLFDEYVFLLEKSAKILDVGTGNGRFIFELAKKGFKNLHGIDMAERLLSIARERSRKSYPFLKFHKMSASELNYDSNVFDLYTTS